MSNQLPELASAFARKAHEGQTRKYTGDPYYSHVERVAALVAEHADRQELIAAAFLHDTIEDCGVSYEEIAQQFGYDVADIVQALTNDEERKNKMGKVSYMIDKLTNMNPDALLVKLCDTLNNMTETQSAHQAHQYFLIVEGVLKNPPLGWNKLHEKLASKIQDVYRVKWALS